MFDTLAAKWSFVPNYLKIPTKFPECTVKAMIHAIGHLGRDGEHRQETDAVD